MKRRGIAALGLSALVLVGVAAGAAATVGGPPTMDFKRCFKFIKPCGDPVVLGEGQHFNGPLEIVGMSSRRGLCTSFENLGDEFVTMGCGGPTLPPGDRAIAPSGISWTVGGDPNFTEVDGLLTPDVAKVRVRYHRNGIAKRRRALVAQVDGALLAQIDESEPFGIFETTMRGCLASKRFSAKAFDSSGAPIGTAHFRVALPKPCSLRAHNKVRTKTLEPGADKRATQVYDLGR